MSAEMGPGMAAVAAAPGRGEIGGAPRGVAVAPRAEVSSLHMPGFVNMVGDIAPSPISDFHSPPAASGKDIFAGLTAYDPAMDAAEVSHAATPVTEPTALPSLQAKAEMWGAYMALYAQPIGGASNTGAKDAGTVAEIAHAPFTSSEAIMPEVQLGHVALTPEIEVPKAEAVQLVQEVTPSVFDPAPVSPASDEAVAARAVTLLEELGMEDEISDVDAVLAERKQEESAQPITAAAEAEEVVDEITKPQDQVKTAVKTAGGGLQQTAVDTDEAVKDQMKEKEKAEEQPQVDESTPPPPEDPKDPEEPDKEPDDDTPRPPRREVRFVHDDSANSYRAFMLQAIANTERDTNESSYKLIQGVRMRDEFLRLASSDPNAKSSILDEGDHDGSIDYVGNEFAQQGLLTQEEVETRTAYAISRHTAVAMADGGIVAKPEEIAKVTGNSRRYASLPQAQMPTA